jgi:hypothetical protein
MHVPRSHGCPGSVSLLPDLSQVCMHNQASSTGGQEYRVYVYVRNAPPLEMW